MFLGLTWIVLAASCLLAVMAAVATLRARPIDNPMFYVGIATQVLLVLLLLVGIATMSDANHAMNKGIFVAYLIGLLFVLPVAGFWAIAERESRWGTGVLLVGTVGLAVMLGRLFQLWHGQG